MHGTIYYYYDKVLVADCKLKTLEPYVGRLAKDSAVQLLVKTLDVKNADVPTPTEIVREGDFYLAAPSGNMIYQIHKNGTLIRAYAAEVSQVEETIMDVPMSILAMIEGKLLLHGTVISVRGDTYAVLGGEEMLKCSGLSHSDTILLTENMEGYRGILCFRMGKQTKLYGQRPITGLKGIVVLQNIGQGAGGAVIMEHERKERLLLEHTAGFSMLSREMHEYFSHGRMLKEAGQSLPVAVLGISEGCRVRDILNKDDFSIFP